MSLLAAAAPVAVLVLAWDETTPAVRALVDATETTGSVLDSVVVLVPAAAGELTQEEYLPLAEEPTPAALPVGDERFAVEETQETQAEPALLNSLPVLLNFPVAEPEPADYSAEEPVTKSIAVAAEPALAWSAVRVLRLSSFSLPELTELSHQALPLPIWQRSMAAPAAPYLGSLIAVADAQARLAANLATAQPVPTTERRNSLADAGLLPAPPPPHPTPPEQPLPALPMLTAGYLSTELPLPALDAEADLAPIVPDALADQAAALSVAKPAGAAQAGWSESLASLRGPLPLEEPTPATDLEDEATYYAATAGEQAAGAASAGPAELQPPRQPFAAPNLNFQVIQYARFAVPVALAQLPFGAIYAPAWPTWLAAQELRQRTRQPLVLHVTTLAADAEESIETAAGWQAELQRQALQRADLILAETPELTHRLWHDLGLPPERVRTVLAADAGAVAQALRTAQLRPSLSAS